MSNINRNVRVEFGIVGIGGFMSFKKSGDGYSSEILNPIFACESSKIKTYPTGICWLVTLSDGNR